MAEKEIPFSTEKGGVFPAGQLLVASDEGSFDAFVVNFSFSLMNVFRQGNRDGRCMNHKIGRSNLFAGAKIQKSMLLEFPYGDLFVLLRLLNQ